MKSASRIAVAFLLLFSLAAGGLSQGVGQPNYQVKPYFSAVSLPAGTTVTRNLCFYNEGPAPTYPLSPGDLQTFNVDVSLGSVIAVTPIQVINPTPVTPVANPTVSGDWTVSQGIGNPNKVFFTFSSVVAKDLQAGSQVCTTATINVSATPTVSRVKFYGNLTVLAGQPPFITVSVE